MADGLITLTRPQFQQKRPGGNYQHYLRYIARRRTAGTPQAPTDPYSALIAGAPQPFTPQQIQQELGQYTQGMPSPYTPGQIQSQASSMISPLIQAITSSITGQAQNASNAVKGYTADLASKLAAINFASPYVQGEQAQAATNAALHQSLAGAGSSDAKDLAARLAVINDPSVGQAATAVAANGAGNANANLGLGTDALSNLIANAAAAGSFGQKLPGIAQLGGIQQLAGIGQNATNQIASQTQQIESQLPQIIQNLTSQSDSNATNRAQARQQLIQYLLGTNDSRSKDLTALRENQIARGDSINAAGAKNQTALDIANTNANAKATAAQIAQANKDRSYRLQLAKTIGYDPITNKPLPGYKWANGEVGGIIVKTGTAKGGGKAATPGEVQSFVNTLPTYETQSSTDGSGNRTSKKVSTGNRMNFRQAYQQLRQMGQTDQQARTLLDPLYPRGSQGRGWLTNEEQTALRVAQANTAGPRVKLAGAKTTTIIDASGVKHQAGYLTPQQVAWLQAAKLLPAGEYGTLPNTSTRVYWIRPS